MRKTWIAGLTACLLVLSLTAATVVAQDAADSKGIKILKLLDNGMNHFRLGEFDEAAEIFGQIMALDPDNELALVMRQRAGTAALLKMLENKELAPHAQAILKQSQVALTAQRRSPEEIRALIGKFTAEKVVDRWMAERQLIAIGSITVPYLLDYLDTERDSARGMTRAERVSSRAHAQKTIVDMGRKAVLPLVEALKSASAPLQIEACRLLGKIGDERAIPGLLTVKEQAAKESKRLYEAALSALQEIAGRTNAAIDMPAIRAYFALAESYYYGDPRIIDYVPALRRILWDYNPEAAAYEERITYVEVPQYAYNELTAEKLVCEGLGVHDVGKLADYLIGAKRRQPGDPVRNLLALLAANNYAQLIETRALAAGRPVTADLVVPDAVVAQAEQRARELENIHQANRLIGSVALHDALARLLKDNDNPQALECIADLRMLQDTTLPDAQNALHKAMLVPNRAVRYAATEAMMHLAPSGGLGATDLTVANIIAATSQQTLPNIGVISRDRALYALLADNMSQAGLPSERMDSIAATLSRTRTQTPFISALVVDTRALEMTLETSIDTLRKDAITQFMPIVVITPPENVPNVRTTVGGKVVEIVSLKAKAENVTAATKAAMQKPTESADSHALAQQRLISLLNTLATLPLSTKYPVKGAAAPIASLLAKHPDDVRIPAAKALEAIGAPGALHELLEIYLQASVNEELRLAAGHAAVAALRTPAEPTPMLTADERAALLKLAQGDGADDELQAVAVRLFGMLADKLPAKPVAAPAVTAAPAAAPAAMPAAKPAAK